MDISLIIRVNAGSCFVEQNYGRILKDRSCNGYSLLFSSRESRTAFAYHCVIAIFERRYKFVAAGLFAGCDNIFLRCALFSESDIVKDGIVKKIYILKNHTYIFKKAFRCHCFYIRSANAYRTRIGIPKAGNQVYNGAFSTTAFSDKRSHAVLRYMKTHIFDNS